MSSRQREGDRVRVLDNGWSAVQHLKNYKPERQACIEHVLDTDRPER